MYVKIYCTRLTFRMGDDTIFQKEPEYLTEGSGLPKEGSKVFLSAGMDNKEYVQHREYGEQESDR